MPEMLCWQVFKDAPLPFVVDKGHYQIIVDYLRGEAA